MKEYAPHLVWIGFGKMSMQGTPNFVVAKSKYYRELIQTFAQNNVLISDISGYEYGESLLQNTFRISIPSEKDLNKVIEIINHFFQEQNKNQLCNTSYLQRNKVS